MATQVKRMKMEPEGATIQSLNWDHPVQLIGEKSKNPYVPYCCMKCTLPIFVYGRMLPCRHILCLDCAKKTAPNGCLKCGDKVNKMEALGIEQTLVMCVHGGSRHGGGGCRRTYVSVRDMEAHVAHRHKRKEKTQHMPVSQQVQQTPTMQQQPAINQQQMMMSMPAPGHINTSHPPPGFMGPPTHIPPGMMTRPPHGMMQQGGTPPRGLPVSMQQAHPMQSNPITLQGSMQQSTIQASIQPMSMQQSTMAHVQPQTNMPPMQAQPGMQPMPATGIVRPVRFAQTVPQGSMPPQRMPMQANPMSQHSRPPAHQQQLQGHQQHQQQRQPAPRPHVVRQHRPPQAAVRPMSQAAPVQSKSHGNLISIPIQGSNNWNNQGQQNQNQQQWQNQSQGGQQHY